MTHYTPTPKACIGYTDENGYYPCGKDITGKYGERCTECSRLHHNATMRANYKAQNARVARRRAEQRQQDLDLQKKLSKVRKLIDRELAREMRERHNHPWYPSEMTWREWETGKMTPNPDCYVRR